MTQINTEFNRFKTTLQPENKRCSTECVAVFQSGTWNKNNVDMMLKYSRYIVKILKIKYINDQSDKDEETHPSLTILLVPSFRSIIRGFESGRTHEFLYSKHLSVLDRYLLSKGTEKNILLSVTWFP